MIDIITQLRKRTVATSNIATPETCTAIIAEAEAQQLTRAKEVIGVVQQDFFEATIDVEKTIAIREMVKNVAGYLKNQLDLGGENYEGTLGFNEIRYQKYPAFSRGITVHKDESRSRNLIVILLLEGESCFFVCDDREGTNKKPIEARPGTCIIMQAPGLFGEWIQPFHGVENIKNERKVLCMRFDRTIEQL